jgi:hypothetical protein
MVPIVKERNLPFHQGFGKRRLIIVNEATSYSDGQHKLLWLSFLNDFVEPTFAMQIELTQFNHDQQVIQKSRIQLKEFICYPGRQQTINSPIVIMDKCEAIGIKIIAVSFRSLELTQDILTPAFISLPSVRPTTSNTQQIDSGPLKMTNPLGWLLVWVLFWIVVALIITIATFQFGLI